MRARIVYLAICLLAALVPLAPSWQRNVSARPESQAFPGWPSHIGHRPIYPVKMSERELAFYKGFPGRAARFTDGERDFILRWVHTGSRRLHSSADCFRGLGYAVRPEAASRDGEGEAWSGFRAVQGVHRLRVYEQIRDMQGRTWTDVSGWYWSSVLGQSQGPWLAVTQIDKDEG